MSELSKLPNIGKVLEENLIKAGINTPEDLKKVGTKETFMRVKTIDNGACFCVLCAIEGAIEGVRWHNLSEETKKDLREFFNKLK